jgi:hypothetical protein
MAYAEIFLMHCAIRQTGAVRMAKSRQLAAPGADFFKP